MSWTLFSIIASWAFIAMLLWINMEMAKELGRIKREVERNRDDVIYVQNLLGQTPWHDHIEWGKADQLDYK